MSEDKPLQDQIPPENANDMPGASVHTAGGKVKDASIVDALKTIKLGDFKEVHKKPCVRDALLAGIGLGFGAGGVRAILGGMIVNKRSLSVWVDQNSIGLERLLLGCGCVLLFLHNNARILSKKEEARKRRDATRGGGH